MILDPMSFGRDIQLKDDRPETLADAFGILSARKEKGDWGDPSISRQLAESQFSLEAVSKSLIEMLQAAAMDRRVGY